jgi:hypothetical protein
MVLFGFAMNPALGGDNSTKNQANWDKLKQLLAGLEIRVMQKDGTSIGGKFHNVTEESITLTLPSGEQTIGRQSIHRISIKGKAHRLRNTLIGVGIGAGAGAGVGAAYKGCPSGDCIGWSRGGSIGIGAGLGVIVGAIIGAVIPTGSWHDIYRDR